MIQDHLPGLELPKLMLIDASSYLYRAFHAIRQPLLTKGGFPTSAIYGVTNMMWRILKQSPPDYIVAVWDPPGKNFRHELYAEYKANRSAMPDDLRQQVPYVKEIIEGLGIPQLMEQGFEADDIIAAVVKKLEGKARILIVSGDKDLCQLVSDDVTIWEPMKDETYDRQGVFDRLGIWPEQVADYLALCGDASDNIPGVAGIGPKTAAALLSDFSSLDRLLSGLNQIKKQTLREKLEKKAELLPLWKKLVSLNADVCVQENIEAFHRKKMDIELLEGLFQRFEFEKLGRDILNVCKKNNPIYRNDTNSSADFPKKTDVQPLFQLHDKSFDFGLESDLPEPAVVMINDISELDVLPEGSEVAISLAIEHGGERLIKAVCLAWPEDEKVFVLPLNTKGKMASALKEIFSSFDLIIGTDLKEVMKVLLSHDIQLHGSFFDLKIAMYLLDKRISHLPFLATSHTFRAIDPKWLLSAKSKTLTAIETTGMKGLFEEIEMPLLPILAEMEGYGVLVDKFELDRLDMEFEKIAQTVQSEIFALAGQTFNLNSPKQLGYILFDVLGLPTQKKTRKKTGFSTDNEVLTELSATYEIASKILKYRNITKLHSTYIQGLKTVINPLTGRIHTTFNQDVTATGRLSSSEPNLQNIPIRTEEGRQIRRVFVAPPGRRLVIADYSQIELRILAHYSGDETLCQTFFKHGDIHTMTASEVFGVALVDVTSDMRRFAKTVNFGIVYGMSAFGLAKNIGVTQKEAKKFIESYFRQYPGVKAYMETVKAEARRNGFITTLFGRRRYLPELASENKAVREAAERMAINTPIQGTAADIIKLAMIEVSRWLNQSALDAKMLLQVHDELVIEALEKDAPLVASQVKKIMEGVTMLGVPLVVDTGIGANWAEAK